MANFPGMPVDTNAKKRKASTQCPSTKASCTAVNTEGLITNKANSVPPVPPDQPAAGVVQDISKCSHCFLAPCIVTSNGSALLGRGQAPSYRNPAIRRPLYRRFWNIINHAGGWNTPEYIQRKLNIGGHPGILEHQREIMADCVTKAVRDKYPNPIGQAYMGHKWE